MKVRIAEKIDSDDWASLRNSLWPSSIEAHKKDIENYFDGISNDICQVFIVCVNTAIVGFIELNIRNYAEGSSNPKIPYIEGWYVKPEIQGRGFGKALIQAAEDWALSLGFHELASDAEITNKKSISAHKNLGFEETERVVCFLKKL